MKIAEQAKTIGTAAKAAGIKTGITVFGWIISLCTMAAVLVVGNLILVGGQRLWHRDDYAKLDSMKKQMEERKTLISTEEAALRSKAAQLNEAEKDLDKKKNQLAYFKTSLTQLRNKIDSTEKTYPDGIPSEEFSNYKLNIAEYNRTVRSSNKLVGSYNKLRDEFNAAVDAYNTEHGKYSGDIRTYNGQVVQANAVSSRIGSTIVLVPGIGRRSRARAH